MGSKIKTTNRQIEAALPSISSKPKPTAAASETTERKKVGRMTISVPVPRHRIAELDRVRMDVRPLSRLQRKGLVELTSALIESDFCLQDQTKVTRQCHAIKWVLERFGEFAEKS